MSGLPPREPADLKALWNATPTEPDYLVPRLLGRGEVCLLAGAPESGKTMLLTSLAAAVAGGSPVFGEFAPANPSRVLYLDEEVGKYEFVRRLRMLAAGMYLDLELLYKNLRVFPQQGYPLHNDERIGEFHRAVSDFDPQLIVVDTFVSVYCGDENDNSAVRRWFDRVVTPIRTDSRSVVISHHLNKEKEDDKRTKLARIRGATDFRSYPDKVWMCQSSSDLDHNETSRILRTRLSTIKARRGDRIPPFPVEFRNSNDGTRILLSRGEFTPSSASLFGQRRVCKDRILDLLRSEGGSCQRTDLAVIPNELGCSRKTLNRAIKDLENEGHIVVVSDNGNGQRVTIAACNSPG